MPAAAPLVIDLGERIRDVGGQVIVTAQSYQGLGDNDDERQRLIDASRGGLIVHAQRDPEKLLEAAGTTRKPEQSWQLDESGRSGMGSMRMGHKMTIDPDLVRKAGVGEAWAIANGKYVHMQVLPVPRPPSGTRPAQKRTNQPPAQRPRGKPPERPETPDAGGDPFDA